MAKYYKLNGLTLGCGNKKLDKSILIWNLPAVKTCPNCGSCAKTCYAFKPERIRSNVKACRESNYIMSQRSSFVSDMVTLIRKLGRLVVRIHESGDFYSQEYADKWSRIAQLLPEVWFYCYTKSPYHPDADNINVIESILPGGELNYGKAEHILPLAQKYDAFVCPCKPKDRSKLCGTVCTVCQTAKHVVFIQH